MEIDNKKGNLERFILYLYLCAAEADFEIDNEEVELIRSKLIERGLVSAADFEEHWQKARHEFKHNNDFESEKYIETTCEELNLSTNERQKIYDDLKEIMNVDGKEDAEEKLNLFMFKKLLKI